MFITIKKRERNMEYKKQRDLKSLEDLTQFIVTITYRMSKGQLV